MTLAKGREIVQEHYGFIGDFGKELMDEIVSDFQKGAEKFDVPLSVLGSTIQVQGKPYLVVGLEPKSRKQPVVMRSLSGPTRTYKATLDVLK